MRLTFYVLLVAVVFAGCNQQEAANTNEPVDNWAYDSYPNRFPDFSPGNGMPGSFGEPPRTVVELKAPIQLVQSGMFLDGGTRFAHIRDADGHEAIICLSQSAFESEIPPRTLYVGSYHPGSQSARLPLTNEEAFMLCRSLQQTLRPLEEERDEILKREEPPSQSDQQLLSAFQMLTDLSTIKTFSLADPGKLEDKIFELTNVDMKSLGETFRKSEGQARELAWQKLKPAMISHINAAPEIDRTELLTAFLGEPEPDTEDLFPGKIVYVLSTENNSSVYLVFDIGDNSPNGCSEIRVTTPNQANHRIHLNGGILHMRIAVLLEELFFSPLGLVCKRLGLAIVCR